MLFQTQLKCVISPQLAPSKRHNVLTFYAKHNHRLNIITSAEFRAELPVQALADGDY